MENRLDFNIESEKVKEDAAIKIKYMLEDKFQLEQEIRAGENAQMKLDKLEYQLKLNMMIYASIGGNENE